MAEQHNSQQFLVEIDGKELAPEVSTAMNSVVVEDNLHVPDSFELSFRDPGRTLLAEAGLTFGATVKISVQPSGESGPVLLLTGEITAVALEIDGAGTRTVATGYDLSHRLFLGRRCEIHSDVSYADCARAVARRNKLKEGDIQPTRPIHQRVAQDNTTDWQFLQRLAREVGYEVSVVDGSLHFRPPAAAAKAPEPGTLDSAGALQLRLGDELLRINARVSAAEQVAEVEVRGWDPGTKKPLVAVAPAKTASVVNGADPAAVAAKFGGHRLVLTDPPYRTQAEVDTAAKAAADHVAGAFAELAGLARGNARLRAGTPVSIGLAGSPFDGRYTLTRTRHRYDARDGYAVSFNASGRQDRSLLALAGGSAEPQPRTGGVVPGMVTDVADPLDQGRVKVRFPWLAEDYTSDWLRVVSAGAGARRGMVMLPEVDDEVLVAFEQGDLRHGYVLGGLYNGVDTPQLGEKLIDATTGAVRRRGFVSRRGHSLVFLDDAADSGVALLAEQGKLRISLHGTQRRIRITADGAVEISGTEVTVKASGNATIQAGGQLRLKGATVKVEASGPVEVTGTPIKLN
ncbi:type IV secretion protein Rhs [Catellatospora sp. TT07R-123]|uniref:VgrG-related protein n=1 Tax=Catellatospora sp. TT07R-123 TaxID=2733863 RepID=UPI001B018885|nr:VgrG-related protein [Catellatospora sp. TT07R-123]GHJ45269.1 type IV secretion protein Rhs [Catellatospora sp. TT07R-123]